MRVGPKGAGGGKSVGVEGREFEADLTVDRENARVPDTPGHSSIVNQPTRLRVNVDSAADSGEGCGPWLGHALVPIAAIAVIETPVVLRARADTGVGAIVDALAVGVAWGPR